jgi:signal peptidase I
MSAPSLTSNVAPPPAVGSRWKIARFTTTVLATAALSVAILRGVMPSSLEGARGGVTGFLGWLGELHPLVLGVSIFVILSELGRYWSRRWGIAIDAPVHAAAGSVRGSVRRIGVALAIVAVAAFLTRSSFIAAYRVVGPSMLPTLEKGDRVLVDRTAYGLKLPFSKHRFGAKTPQRGDLVVFPMRGLPGTTGVETVVKRVVGLPGDKVSFIQGALIINDQQVPGCDAGPYVDLTSTVTVRGRLVVEYLGARTYLTVRKPVEAPFEGTTVKPGEVFVIGDDRGMSTDSRVWSEGHGGGVPIDGLDGRVTRVLLGARPDGRLDWSRLLAPPLDLKVRQPGLDMTLTDQRIADCLKRRP